MTPHDRELHERLTELERDPLWDVTAADHTDRYRDPDKINGHVPDYTARSVFGQTLIGEVEAADDQSQHTQQQHQAFQESANQSPLREFEVEYYGDDNESSGDPFSLFHL